MATTCTLYGMLQSTLKAAMYSVQRPWRSSVLWHNNEVSMQHCGAAFAQFVAAACAAHRKFRAAVSFWNRSSGSGSPVW